MKTSSIAKVLTKIVYIRTSVPNGSLPNMSLQINLNKLYFLLSAGSKIIIKSEQRKITGELIRLQNQFGERRQK